MTNYNHGIAFHAHHNILLEECPDYEKRVEEIRRCKPRKEQMLRLRLFKLIPSDKLPPELATTYEAYDKAKKARAEAWEARVRAEKAYNKADADHDKAWEGRAKNKQAYAEALKARGKAWEAQDKAYASYNKAWEAYMRADEAQERALEDYMPSLEKLHGELCLDCPWNGGTIFTRQNDAGQWY